MVRLLSSRMGLAIFFPVFPPPFSPFFACFLFPSVSLPFCSRAPPARPAMSPLPVRRSHDLRLPLPGALFHPGINDVAAGCGILPLDTDGASQAFGGTMFDRSSTDHADDIAIPLARGGGAPQNPLSFVLPGRVEYWSNSFILLCMNTDDVAILPLSGFLLQPLRAVIERGSFFTLKHCGE